MRYQFQVDHRPAGPVRDRWEDAAGDAIIDGYARWLTPVSIAIDPQASIARIPDAPRPATPSHPEGREG